MTSALGFKARVDSLACVLTMATFIPGVDDSFVRIKLKIIYIIKFVEKLNDFLL